MFGQCVLLVENYGKKPLVPEDVSWLPGILYSLKDTVVKGMIPTDAITQAINAAMPPACAMTNKGVGCILRKIGLNTKITNAGYSHLVCDELFTKLMDRYKRTSTTSTTSTIGIEYPKTEGMSEK